MSAGVIFDVDGTLVDSVDVHALAWQEALSKFGIDVDIARVRYQIGKGGDELLQEFLSRGDVHKFGNDLKEYRSKLFKSSYIQKIKPFPKVKELVERLQADSLLVAVGSSAHEDELDHYLDLLHIKELIQFKTTSDDVERAKPHPDIFELLLSRMRISANEATVIGDSPHDARAASNANIESIIGVLCGGFAKHDLAQAGAKQFYQSPEDLLAHYTEIEVFQQSRSAVGQ